MPPIPADQLRLTRLDATLWDEQGYAYVKHNYYGWQKAAQQEFVWRRTYKPIGQGGFGAVFCEECVKGSSKGTVRAVKSLQKPTSASPRAVDYSRELEAIARFSRPEYVRWFVQSSGWYEDDHAVFIVMEYLSYGSLQQYLGSGLPESQVKRIITQVLEGLRCMHAAGYSHRDVKPQNLLVVRRGPDWQIKIADFGLSKRVAESLSSMRTVAGTPGYTALEVLGLTEDDSSDDSDVSDTSRRSYSSKVDIWAVGAIAFVSLTGELPFPARNSKALRKYVNGKAPFPSSNLETKSVSALACRQLEEFMAPDPMRRPGAEKALHTAWLKNTLQPSHPHLAVNSSEVPRAEPESFSASGRWTDAGDSGYQTTIQQDARKIAPFADDDSGYMYHTIVPQRLRNVVSDAPTCPWRLVQQVKDLPRFDSGQVKFGEDSSYLALFSEHSRSPGSLLLWNAASNEIKTRDFPKSKAQWREQQYAVTQTPSGIRVFASDLRGSIKVFRVLESVLEEETKMLAEQIPASVKGWASVAFSSDGRFAMRLSFRSDGLIGKTSDQPKAVGTFENWDLATGKRLHHFQLPRELTYEGSIAHWTPSPDGRLVAFYKFPRVKSSSPRVLIVLDVSKGSVQALVLEHTVMREIDFLAFSPDVSLLAAPFRTREIIIWKIDTLSRHSFKPKPIRVITCRALLEASCYFEFTPDGERIVVQVSDGSQPDFYDVRTGEQTSETLPLVPAGRRGSFRFSPDGLLLAMLTWESTRRESPTETLALYRRDP